jgi:hypothetical protein
MNIDEDRYKAMKFRHPRYIPVGAYFLPAVWMKHRERLEPIVARHPIAFRDQQASGPRDYDAASGHYVAGRHVDAWGCVWESVRTGMDAIVKQHPVPTREAVRTLKAPPPGDAFPHGFMYLRLGDLRGFEEIMIDFAEEPPELRMLLDKVLEHNMQTLERVLAKQTPPDLVWFGDDLGMQASLPISPAKWREYLKPCFAKIYGRCHEAGFDVYMHTDGHIWEIIPDLIACGVNVVNPQVRANGLGNLARVCRGKVCVCLDLDRQMFPFCKPADIDPHVREAVEALGSPEGGLWLSAEIGPDVPLENVEAIAAALEKYRTYFS